MTYIDTADTTGSKPYDERDLNDNVEEMRDEALGSILMRMKGLSRDQVEKALSHQRAHGGRMGEAFVALRLAEPRDVVWALSQQFHYPYAPSEPVAVDSELVVASDPFSEDVEAFRDLRTQLLMGVLSPDLPRAALSVVSANAGDGKSFVAANLAIAFSQLPGRTLLIDADLRTPRLDKLFKLNSSSGLTTILSGRSDSDVIHPIPNLPNLFVLPVGVAPPNPTELVQRSAFPLLMRELLLKFDFVVLDTPAASHGSDALVIAARSGAALVLARKNYSHTAPLQKLVRQLSKSAVRLAGIVANDH